MNVTTPQIKFPDCIQCGLCLEACPTYRLTKTEDNAARGRVILVRALSDSNNLSWDQVAPSLDQCLLCGSCQAACPSGVSYIAGIDTLRDCYSGNWSKKMPRLLRFLMSHVVERPGLLKAFLELIRTSIKLGFASLAISLFFPKAFRQHFRSLIESIKLSDQKRSDCKPEQGTETEEEAETSIFHGCITPVFFPEVISAWRSILDLKGITCHQPRLQGCCGALHQHHGDLKRARNLARRNIDAFAGSTGPILVEAAGCGAALRSYGDLLRDDPDYAESAIAFSARIADVVEYLAARQTYVSNQSPQNQESGIPGIGTKSIKKLIFQEPCHLRHLQMASKHTELILGGIYGIKLQPAPEVDLCCGSAGIYNLLQPGLSAELGDRKAALLAELKPDLVVTSNPGCRIQLAGRLADHGVEMRHALELIELDLKR